MNAFWGLTPHGVSGLKFKLATVASDTVQSHPTRGEWIEMPISFALLDTAFGLTPHGVSGLKCHNQLYCHIFTSLTPHGVSGLKLDELRRSRATSTSHPTRGEWIEMCCQ